MLTAGEVGDIEIRPFRDGDPISALTQLLNGAYRPLADMGMRYVASWQGDDITRQRLAHGECLLALIDARIVGTIQFSNASQARGSPWSDRADVASIHQFAVEPRVQRLGMGTRLIEMAESRAAASRACEIALDTSEHAKHLIDWYARLGYRFVEYVDWHSTNYRSVIMSKGLLLPKR